MEQISGKTFYGCTRSNRSRIVNKVEDLATAVESDGEVIDDDDVLDPDFNPDIDEPGIQFTSQDDAEDQFESEETVVLELQAENSDSNRTARQMKRGSHTWIKKDGMTEIPEFQSEEDSEPEIISLEHPFNYFKSIITDDFLDLVVEQSNLFSVQQNCNKPLNTTRNEIEQWLGLVLLFSISKLPDTRMHWSKNIPTLMNVASSVMSRDRFEAIKRNFHLVDNSASNDRSDKMMKVRPMIEQLRREFRKIEMPQRLCVDEQLVPFKGRSQIKQYIPSKPHKWGYKLFVLADTKGLIYDFFPYTGRIDPVSDPNVPDLKASSNVVLHLAQNIPPDKNHLLFFDNWFTSLPLLNHLATRKIWCCGTVRVPRLPGIPKGKNVDKELTKKGRGSFDELILQENHKEICYVKWHDNKIVNLISNFARALPVTMVERFDRTFKKTIEVPCPDIVQKYNKSMGGVDLADSLIALYRISLRSKKYYMRMVFHMLDMSISNAWLLYRRDAEKLHLEKKDILHLSHFKLMVAGALIEKGKSLTQRRGRPSCSEPKNVKKPKRMHCNSDDIIRFDKVDHFPLVQEKRNRCRMNECNGKTQFMCKKCKVFLCITVSSNCFSKFHGE